MSIDKSDEKAPGLIPPHGGYRELKSYQNEEIVYDAAVAFCNRFIDRRSRTHDQMVQAARSGKQNIVEGSMASGTLRATPTSVGAVREPPLQQTAKTSCGSAAWRFGARINYLLDQQLRQLERQFVEEGGFTEKLYRTRIQARQNRGRPAK